ncbi:head closure Hc1 [Gordonia phage Fairfaxidum]|uniref:Head-to-tail stopper n=1 Tax=Gordonia phage Fairfaxidum TaxID=2572526 RepID=A0A4D6TE45_9CAUD|nr:head closure Hc1 [Gordonia phage Fairfaxidum]QCG77592.1 head-to-tail stopper [Gordonia phage Fairfaxidum]
MKFFTEQIVVVRPARIVEKYNPEGEFLSFDPADGVQRIPVPFGVEVQPRAVVETDDNDTRVATHTVLWVCTPTGRDIDVEPTDRVAYRGRDHEVVGEIKRWPSPDHESGVDHVEFTIEFKNG